ncbi:uncharacterized protein LOC115761010 [Drosophila novamexicana]|uniref:Regulatory protein zeste n=1 Tax=Drosophila virilis TaxID=7244 RepID=B4LN18_DROVI|nr:uncharacterized protein LOC6626950 [Drosophila virilis]XP_030558480.1 uncharacterized protein LOC115761010 [Drosophila novamexicana]EDW62133.1 uncharacterized protein Dvir_GJ22426 [Drosophila virilis]
MDRRKKRTSSEQYQMYIELMESDPIFASGRVPRDYDLNYLTRKWKELSDRLNKCGSGPTLTAEEWRKRLNDWKNTTRCKYRRSLMSSEKDISMSSLETRALNLFGKVPGSGETLMNLKSEKDDQEDDMEELGQRTSASFQKDLQAAVEEAINDEDEDEMVEEHVDQEDLTDENMHEATGGIDGPNVGGTTAVNTSGGGYRTIVVDNSTYVEEEQDHPEPPVEPVKFVCTTNIHSAGSSGGTKLINGELPVKRLRRDQVIYEVKNAPRSYTTIQAGGSLPTLHNTKMHHEPQGTTLSAALSGLDAQEIAHQLKRLADINYETLQFEIARFKFNNPGFHYEPPPL